MKISEATFYVVDIETTGLDPLKDGIVEFASVKCSLQDGVDHAGKRSYSTLLNPGIPIPPSASAIHHITSDDVGHLPARESGITEQEMFCHDPSIQPRAFAAHNAEFDFAFLPACSPVVCTCRLARKLWPDLDGFGNQFLRYQLGLPIPPEIKKMAMHRAFPDAVVTAFLLLHELREVIQRSKSGEDATVEDLVEWISEPMLLRKIRFGKHSGMLWSEVPKSYLGWIIDKMDDADIDTLHTARHYLNSP